MSVHPGRPARSDSTQIQVASLASEAVTISVVQQALSREAEKHLADSAGYGWARQRVGEALHGAGWSASQPEDCGQGHGGRAQGQGL